MTVYACWLHTILLKMFGFPSWSSLDPFVVFFPLLIGFTAPEGLSKDGLGLEIQRIRNLVFPMIQWVIRR